MYLRLKTWMIFSIHNEMWYFLQINNISQWNVGLRNKSCFINLYTYNHVMFHIHPLTMWYLLYCILDVILMLFFLFKPQNICKYYMEGLFIFYFFLIENYSKSHLQKLLSINKFEKKLLTFVSCASNNLVFFFVIKNSLK